MANHTVGRKADPGARFDWRALAQMGFGIWADPETATGVEAAVFDANLGRIGYDPDAPLEMRLRAFRLHFRPVGAGPLDAVDCAIAAALANKFQLT